MEFAIQVSGTYDDVLAAARFSEDRGLPALALPDHYLMASKHDTAATTPAPDALIQLAGLARDTSDIDLVVLVSPITFRHPAVLAKTAITIDRMSGGRFTLGVGTGWMDREHEVFGFDYPPMGERFAMLEEALGYLTAALADEPQGFAGKLYQLEKFPIAPRPLGKVKLLVGGVGRSTTPRLAGEYADEFNVYPGPELPERIQRARGAAVGAGRDPDSILMSSAGQVVAEETEADLEMRLDEMASDDGITREELDRFHERRHTPRGTYEQVRTLLAGMEAAGVRRFYLQGGFDPGRTPQLLDVLGG